jgi:hypothetical protein
MGFAVSLTRHPIGRVIQESVMIFGWVANWWPIENLSLRLVADRSSSQDHRLSLADVELRRQNQRQRTEGVPEIVAPSQSWP